MYLKLYGKHIQLKCKSCQKSYDLYSKDINIESPVLLDCGHDECYECFQKQLKQIDFQVKMYMSGIESPQTHLQYQCKICQKIYIAGISKKKYLNMQMINLTRLQQIQCQKCEKFLSENEKMYFYQTDIQIIYNKFTYDINQFPNEQQNTQSRDIILCKQCTGVQDNIKVNCLFEEAFHHVKTIVCQNQACDIDFTKNFTQICQCSVKNLSEQQKQYIIPNQDIILILKQLERDYIKLSQIFYQFKEIINVFQEPHQTLNQLKQIIVKKQQYNPIYQILLFFRNFDNIDQQISQKIIYKISKGYQSLSQNNFMNQVALVESLFTNYQDFKESFQRKKDLLKCIQQNNKIVKNLNVLFNRKLQIIRQIDKLKEKQDIKILDQSGLYFSQNKKYWIDSLIEKTDQLKQQFLEQTVQLRENKTNSLDDVYNRVFNARVKKIKKKKQSKQNDLWSQLGLSNCLGQQNFSLNYKNIFLTVFTLHIWYKILTSFKQF